MNVEQAFLLGKETEEERPDRREQRRESEDGVVRKGKRNGL